MNPIVSDESFGNGLNVVEYFLYLIVIQLYPVQNGTSNTDYEISDFVKGHVTSMSHVILHKLTKALHPRLRSYMF